MKYLSEPVNYGGEIMARGKALAMIQAAAKTVAPDNPSRQRAMVARFMQGMETAGDDGR